MKKTITVRSFISLAGVAVVGAAFSGGYVSGANGKKPKTPHGGTPVLVAEHKYHLELVRDGAAGSMQAYVLDDDLEKYVAVPETNFTLHATFAGKTEQVEFKRAPDAGESKVAATSSLFESRADWIKSATNFSGMIPSITLKGRTFTNVGFPFPKGTQHTH